MLFFAAAEGELFKEKAGADSAVDIILDTSIGNDSQHRGSVKVEATSYEFDFGSRNSVWVHVEFRPEAATVGGTDVPFLEIRDASDNYIVRLQDDYNNGTVNDVDVAINDGSNTVITTSSFTTTAATFHTADIYVDYTDSTNIIIRVLFDRTMYVNYTAEITGIFGKPAKIFFGDRSSTTTEDVVWYRDVIVSDFPTIGWKLCFLAPDASGTFSDGTYTTVTDVNLDNTSILGLEDGGAVSWTFAAPVIPSGYAPYALAVTAITYSEDVENYSDMSIFLYTPSNEIEKLFTDYTENDSWHVFGALYTETAGSMPWSSAFYDTAEVGIKNAN